MTKFLAVFVLWDYIRLVIKRIQKVSPAIPKGFYCCLATRLHDQVGPVVCSEVLHKVIGFPLASAHMWVNSLVEGIPNPTAAESLETPVRWCQEIPPRHEEEPHYKAPNSVRAIHIIVSHSIGEDLELDLDGKGN